METLETKRIIELFSRKLGLLEEVLGYSKEQRKLTYRDHSLKYDNLIQSRAKCLEDLGKLEVVLERSLNRLSEKVNNDDKFQEKLHAMNSDITATLKQIIELDKENKEKMIQERSDLQFKLRSVRQGRKGIAGYTGSNRSLTGGIFTDNKG
ncbi:MAG: hypothetical protein ACM3YE_12430 [Bacteroidota bacterium]